MKPFKKLALSAGLSGAISVLWLAVHVTDGINVTFFILEVLMFLLIVLFIFNHWKRRPQVIGGAYSMRTFVDVVIPTKNEPVAMLEKTLAAANNILFPNTRIYVADDGNRLAVQRLARKYGAVYLVRPDRSTRAFKAATLNFALQHSAGSYLLTLDADQVVVPKILDDLLGFFTDPKVALVATRQHFDVPEDDFNHDHLFYGYMQTGKNADDSGVSCGSGVVYRRSALQKIGGFQEWNIVEDLYTTYVFNACGYKTLYVAQSYTKGEAPTDLAVIEKQRGTWAQDSLRLFFFRLPVAYRTQLTVRQFFHYFEMGYLYLVSGFVLPGMYLLNFYSLATNTPVVNVPVWYGVFKIVSFYFAIKLYNTLGQGDSSSRMWTALFPVYFRAAIKALLYRKPRYVVTKKKGKPLFHPSLIAPHVAILALGTAATVYHVAVYGTHTLFFVNFLWLLIMLYFLYPIFPKAFPRNPNYVRTNPDRRR